MAQPPSIFDWPDQLHRGWRWLPWLLLLAITISLYGSTLYYSFVWDDWYYVKDNLLTKEWSWAGLKSIWTSDYLGHYAPVMITALAYLRHLFGLDAWGFHLAQILVHSLCVVLVYIVLRKIESGRLALVGALFFVIHPANIESIAWISELKSTLAFLFFLLSFWFYIRFRETEAKRDGVLAALFLILSLLSKINTVVAPAIFLLYDYRQGASVKSLRWKSLAAYFSISAAMTFIHLRAFHVNQQAMQSDYYGGLATHIFGMPAVLAFYFQMIVFPHPISAWQMFPAPNEHVWTNTLGWFGIAAMAWLLWRSSRNTQFWVLWILVFLAPVSQIIPFGIWVADRYLYIPAIGGFVLMAKAFFWLLDQDPGTVGRLAANATMITILALMTWRTTVHLPAWRNDVTLWAATLPHCSQSAYCHSSFGLALLGVGQFAQGLDELTTAVRIDPQSRVFLVYLADSLALYARNYPAAIDAYNRAVLVARQEDMLGRRPRITLSLIYARMTRAYILSDRYEHAQMAIDKGMKEDATDPALWAMQAMLQWKLGSMDGARSAIESLRRITGDQSSTVFNLIGSHWGDRGEVLRFLKEFSPAI